MNTAYLIVKIILALLVLISIVTEKDEAALNIRLKQLLIAFLFIACLALSSFI